MSLLDPKDTETIKKLLEELRQHLEKLFDEEKPEAKRFAKKTHRKIEHLIKSLSRIKSTKTLFKTTSKALYEIFQNMERAKLPDLILATYYIKSEEDLKTFGFIYCLRLCSKKIRSLLNKHGETVRRKIEAIEAKNEWMQDVWHHLDKIYS